MKLNSIETGEMVFHLFIFVIRWKREEEKTEAEAETETQWLYDDDDDRILSLTFAALYKHTDLYSERLKLKCFYLNVQKAKSITPTKFQ